MAGSARQGNSIQAAGQPPPGSAAAAAAGSATLTPPCRAVQEFAWRVMEGQERFDKEPKVVVSALW